MIEDQAEGNMKKIKGKAKEAWGKMTDNEVTEAEGKTDKLMGNVQEKFGDVKQAFRREEHKADRRRAMDDDRI